MRQLVGGVRFAQAAEAAQSVQSKPPEAAQFQSSGGSLEHPARHDFVVHIRFARSSCPHRPCGYAAPALLACWRRRRCGIRAHASHVHPPGVARAQATRAHHCSASRASAARRQPSPQHLRAWRGLTTRSSGATTAGHQARPQGTVYIFLWPGLASCRCRPLSSNVRRQKHCRAALQQNARPAA